MGDGVASPASSASVGLRGQKKWGAWAAAPVRAVVVCGARGSWRRGEGGRLDDLSTATRLRRAWTLVAVGDRVRGERDDRWATVVSEWVRLTCGAVLAVRV